jgi:hypothetical protein
MPVKLAIRDIIDCRAGASHQERTETEHHQKPDFREPVGRLYKSSQAGEKCKPNAYWPINPGKSRIGTPRDRQSTIDPISKADIAQIWTARSGHLYISIIVAKIPKPATQFSAKTYEVASICAALPRNGGQRCDCGVFAPPAIGHARS